MHVIDSVNDWMGKIASFGVLFLIGITVYEVTLRYVFSAPTLWATELGTFIYGTAWLLAGGYALLLNAHVKVDVIYVHLSPRLRSILDITTAPLFIIFAGVLLWKGWQFGLLSVKTLELSPSIWGPPVYLVKMVIPLGALLILLQGLVKITHDIMTAITTKDSA